MRDPIVVFAGPTLSSEAAAALLPKALVLGPAACGDVYRVCQQKPRAILLIDGYFDHQLSVWHKELLWAMSKGTRVYGAASMGALRAAELDAFGMRGIGKIYEWYREGVLEDDDEVAIVHEPANRGYRALSEALVNTRANIERAVAQAVIRPESAARIVSCAKQLFYPDRTLPAIEQSAAAAGVLADELARLRHWLQTNAQNQKFNDACEALRTMRTELDSAETVELKRANFHFEYTESWHELRMRIDAKS